MKTALLRRGLATGLALLFGVGMATKATAQAPDFTVTMEPDTVTLIPGKSAAFVVSLTALNGFSNSVTLATGALPEGVEASFSPNPVTPPGTSVLTLRAATNAATGLFSLELTADGGGITHTTSSTVTVNFGLLPLCYGAFRGVVTDLETGQPVPNADVFASYSSTTRTSADAGGQYSFTNLPLAADNLPAQYALWASRTDYWPSAYAYSYAVCDATNAVNLALLQRRYGTLSGIVTDESNSPLANVSVSISGPVSAFFRTDATGTFQSGDLGLGQNNVPAYYSVVGTTNLYWQANTNTMVAAGSNSVVHLVLIPICNVTVTGSVVYADTGLPATNVYVSLGHPVFSRSVSTDAGGHYVFTNATLNYYNTTANASVQSGATGYYTAYTNLTLATCGETVEAPVLRLEPLPQHNFASVTGHVYDVETGLAISNAVVSLGSQTRTDTLGAYTLTNIDLGTASSNLYGLYASGDAYFTAVSNVWLFAGQISTQDVSLLRIRYGVVTGTVVDSASHSPVANAQVSLPGFNRTGPDGAYQSDPIALNSGNQPRYVAWYTTANGYWPVSTNTTITADQTNVVEIDLIRVCTSANVLGRVIDAVTQLPITGAQVYTYDAIGTYRSVLTDTNGAFALTNLTVGNNNSPSQIGLTASAQGYNPQSKSVTIFCGANILTEFGKPQTVFGAIEGYVTNILTGAPLADVFIGSGFGAATTTDTNGYYAFAEVPLGPGGAERAWQVTAIPGEFPQQSLSVLVSSNQVSRLDFGFGLPTTDLAVTLTGAPDPVTVDSNLTYTVVLRNSGGDAANVSLTDELPAGVTFVGASITNSSGPAFTTPAFNNGRVVTTTTNLLADATATLTVTVTPSQVGTLTNLATVTTDTQDTNPDNDTASATTSVSPQAALEADLAILLVATPNPVAVSNLLTYVITVTNAGPADASAAEVSDLLPVSVNLVSVTPSQGSWTQGVSSLTWSVGPVAQKTSATLTAVVVPTATGLLTNTATVQIADSGEGEAGVRDPNPDDNAATVTTLVTAPNAVEVIAPLALNPQTGLFEQTLRVRNTGDSAIPALRVLITPDTNAVVYNASGMTDGGVPYVLFNQPLAPGAQVDFVIEYYLQNRVPAAQPVFSVEATPPDSPLAPEGTVLSLDRDPMVTQGRVLIEFATMPGRRYAVQYSGDSVTWKTALPPLTAAGSRVQWFDDGPPKTESKPAGPGSRFYRVVELPGN